jgi:hypothetical protein
MFIREHSMFVDRAYNNVEVPRMSVVMPQKSVVPAAEMIQEASGPKYFIAASHSAHAIYQGMSDRTPGWKRVSH